MQLLESRGKVFIFDFDGTLVDSLEVKYRARFEVFAEEPSEVQSIAERVIPCLKGKLRSEIIRAVLKEAYPQKGTEELEQDVLEYVHKYDILVEDRIVQRGMFPGVKEVLEHLSKNNRLYLSSGTPENTLRALVKRLNIEQFFLGIYGTNPDGSEDAQKAKLKNILRISASEQAPPSEVIVIGDGVEDAESARVYGGKFIGILSDRNAWANSPQTFPIVKSICEIQDADIEEITI